MKRPGLIIRVGESAEVADVDVSLKSLQELVGGYIECITLTADARRFLEQGFNVRLGERACIVANDDGIALGLAPNVWASLIYTLVCGEKAVIFGDAVIVDVP